MGKSHPIELRSRVVAFRDCRQCSFPQKRKGRRSHQTKGCLAASSTCVLARSKSDRNGLLETQDAPTKESRKEFRRNIKCPERHLCTVPR